MLGIDDASVTNLTRASLSIRFGAISGKLLYESDYIRISDFVERTIQDEQRQADFEKAEEYWEETRTTHQKLSAQKMRGFIKGIDTTIERDSV